MAAMPIYGKKPLKNLLQNRELSYVDIWPFYGKVKFASLCMCMSPIHLNGKIVENFKRLLLWSHWAKFAQISYWAFLGRENERLLKWSRFIDQDGRHAHINFKNLLLQNRGCLGAESMHKPSGTGALPKLLKYLSYVDIWPFYGKVKFASLCICMSPITFVWENCWEFQTTSPLMPLSKFAQIFSSSEHEVLMVSYCGQSMSVIRRAVLTIALKAYSSYAPGPID